MKLLTLLALLIRVQSHIVDHSSHHTAQYTGPRKGHHSLNKEGHSLNEFLPNAHSTFENEHHEQQAQHHGQAGHHEQAGHGGHHGHHGHDGMVSHPRLFNPVEAAAPSSFYVSPSVDEREQKFTPFQPRFQIGRDEVSDEEWRSVIEEALLSFDLLDLLESTVPMGLVNVNFGTHNCVHMGTEIEANSYAYEPTAISFPADNNQLHTLIMVDADSSPLHLHWLTVNIMGSDLSKGQTVSEYQSPIPEPNSKAHRYVFLVFKQTRNLSNFDIFNFQSSICDNSKRQVDLRYLKQRLGLMNEALAVNFFLGKYQHFVEGVKQYCKN